METGKNNAPSGSAEDLYRENVALRAAAERVLAQQTYLWELYIEVCRTLQLSAAAIKAAVTSVLSREIFWDPGNQHEFLNTINASVDRLSRLLSMFALTFRVESHGLELKPEPQVLQEILATVQAGLASNCPELTTRFILPADGKLALVDYEYLTAALNFLFEFCGSQHLERTLQIQAIEFPEHWCIEVAGLDRSEYDLIQDMAVSQMDRAMANQYAYLPEQILEVYVACEILRVQKIEIAGLETSEGAPVLRLTVPMR
jgi:hypothetical protein